MVVNTLIIPDRHHRVDEAEKIIKAVGPDRIIFLGDYFDDFNDTADDVRHTAEWLEWSVQQPNRIHLWGNHDPQYAYTYRTFQCSGYAQWKYWVVQEVLDFKTWDKLIWYHFLDDTFLLTHGGLHQHWLPEDIQKLHTDRPLFHKRIGEFLDNAIRDGFRLAAEGVRHWSLSAGGSRGGSQRVGGIHWCDYQREFHPIRGLNQIVGHTPTITGTPMWCRGKWNPETGKPTISYPPLTSWTPTEFGNVNHSINICLDVYRNTHWAVWNGKSLKFGNIIEDL